MATGAMTTVALMMNSEASHCSHRYIGSFPRPPVLRCVRRVCACWPPCPCVVSALSVRVGRPVRALRPPCLCVGRPVRALRPPCLCVLAALSVRCVRPVCACWPPWGVGGRINFSSTHLNFNYDIIIVKPRRFMLMQANWIVVSS